MFARLWALAALRGGLLLNRKVLLSNPFFQVVLLDYDIALARKDLGLIQAVARMLKYSVNQLPVNA